VLRLVHLFLCYCPIMFLVISGPVRFLKSKRSSVWREGRLARWLCPGGLKLKDIYAAFTFDLLACNDLYDWEDILFLLDGALIIKPLLNSVY